jgi:hypothetical protein
MIAQRIPYFFSKQMQLLQLRPLLRLVHVVPLPLQKQQQATQLQQRQQQLLLPPPLVGGTMCE